MTSAGAGTHTFKLLDRSADSGAASDATGVALTVDQINVVGVATFPSNINLTDVNIASMSVSGLSTFSGTSDFNGSAEFAQPVTLNSTLNANADVNLGNATSDTITATGRFDSALVPSTDNNHDLGDSVREWRNLFIDGQANIDDLRADTAKVADLTNNRVLLCTSADGEVGDSGNLTFNGSTLGLTGTLSHTGNATHVGDVTFDGATAGRDAIWDRSENRLRLQDNAELSLGNGNDARLVHTDSDFFIANKKGDIYIRNDDSNDNSNIHIQARNEDESILCEDDGPVWLYHDGTWRLKTTGSGIEVNGTLTGNGSPLTNLNASNISSGTISAARLPGSLGGTSTNTDNINIDKRNDNITYSVTFSAKGNDGYERQLIDTDNTNFLYNPNSATLSGLSAVNATNFNGAFNGNGSAITALNGSQVTTGTVAAARIDNLSGAKITSGTVAAARIDNLNANKITAGTMATARLGSGTANGSKYLAGDNQWKTIDLTNLNASNLTSGTVATARLGSGTANSSKFLKGDNTWGDVPPGTTINNNANNRVMTGEGGTTLNGESNLTFDNTSLHVHGSSRQIVCDGNIVAYNSSDITLKDNIQPITNAVEKVLSISGNTFTWNDKAPKALVEFSGVNDTGVIAQEVEKLELPGIVQTKDDGTLGVRYEKLVPLLIEAIKELKGEIDELKSQIK